MNHDSNPPAPTGAGQGGKGEALPPPLASTEAQGSGGQAPQQAAKPSDSDGGNSSRSANYGSLPSGFATRSSTSQKLLGPPISVKLDIDDMEWLDEEALALEMKRSEVIRLAIKTLRYRHPLRPVLLRPRWGDRATFELRQCKSVFHQARLLLRGIKGEAASSDDEQLRKATLITARQGDELARAMHRLLKSLGGITPEHVERLVDMHQRAEAVADNAQLPQEGREAARTIAESLEILGFADH